MKPLTEQLRQDLKKPSTPVTDRFRDAIPYANSVEEILELIEIGDLSYEELRESDPNFDNLARTFDRILDRRLVDRTRAKANEGDSKAQALYFNKLRCPDLAFPRFHQAASLAPRATTRPATSHKKKTIEEPQKTSLTPEMAEAMIAAALYVAGELPEDSPVPVIPPISPKLVAANYHLLELDTPANPQILPVSAGRTPTTQHPRSQHDSKAGQHAVSKWPKVQPPSRRPDRQCPNQASQHPCHPQDPPSPWACENPPPR